MKNYGETQMYMLTRKYAKYLLDHFPIEWKFDNPKILGLQIGLSQKMVKIHDLPYASS